MLPHQPFEFRDDVRMTPQRQVGVDASFECLQPQILQACHVRPCEQFVPELGERLTPEEPQRLAEQRLPLIRGTPLRFGEKPLEAIEIELAVLDVDPVAVATRDPIGTEDLAQAADVTLEGVACRGRRGRTPQRIKGLVDRHPLARVQQEQREQRALLPPRRRDVTAVVQHLQRAEDAELHIAFSHGVRCLDPRQ